MRLQFMDRPDRWRTAYDVISDADRFLGYVGSNDMEDWHAFAADGRELGEFEDAIVAGRALEAAARPAIKQEGRR